MTVSVVRSRPRSPDSTARRGLPVSGGSAAVKADRDEADEGPEGDASADGDHRSADREHSALDERAGERRAPHVDLSDASGSPQKVMGGSSLAIPAGSGVTLELSPDGDWIVV
jgi:hypothetical protein